MYFTFLLAASKHLPFSSTILCSTDFDRKSFPERTVPCSLLQQPQQGDHSIVSNLRLTIITAYDPMRFWDRCDAWGVYVPVALRVLYRFIGICDQTKNPLSSLADLDESAVKQSPNMVASVWHLLCLHLIPPLRAPVNRLKYLPWA